jgi:hypothetical protein
LGSTVQENGSPDLEIDKKRRNKKNYLKRLARVLRMGRVRNETFTTRMGMKKDILQETAKQQLRCYGYSMRI